MKLFNQAVHSTRIKRIACQTAILAAFSCTATTVLADTVQMPPPQPTVNEVGDKPWNVPIPKRGLSKSQVESSFGSPQSREGPSGTPPIYYWEYAEFTVYFESDYVIHAVRKYKPE